MRNLENFLAFFLSKVDEKFIHFAYALTKYNILLSFAFIRLFVILNFFESSFWIINVVRVENFDTNFIERLLFLFKRLIWLND